MTTEKIYGPWIKWSGGECPVPTDTIVEIELRNGDVLRSCLASCYRWDHHGSRGDIVRYRVVVDSEILAAAEKLLLAFSYTVTPPAKPLTFEDITPMTEAPPEGTTYWVIQPFSTKGVVLVCWNGDDHDKSVLRHRMAYLEREHALIAARHIFGLKGGEL